MAEEFLKRLDKLESKLEGLGEVLNRMITILGSVTELKSDMRQSKEEVLEALRSVSQWSSPGQGVTKEEIAEMLKSVAPAAAPSAGITREELVQLLSSMAPITGGGSSLTRDDVETIIRSEMGTVVAALAGSVEELRNEVTEAISEVSDAVGTASIQAAPEAPAHKEAPAAAHPHASSGSLSPDRGMKIADQLDIIFNSLKMGVKAGDLLDIMNEVKTEIMNIVPSDPIMIKIDKWVGIVNTYSIRHEIQARDILKLKKELKEETPKYRPA
jgi:hypothetical protein